MSSLPGSAAAGAAQAATANRRARWRSLGFLARSRATGDAVYALGDQVVYSFGNMVVAALLSRHLTLLEFGIYILTQRVMDVLIQLSNGALWTPLTFGLPGRTSEQRALHQGSVLFWQSCFCAVSSGVLWMLARLVTPRSAGLHATFQPLVLASGGILFREFTRRMYFAHLRLREAFWTDVATVLLQIAGVIWLCRAGYLSVAHTLVVLWVGASVVSAWWVVREWSAWRVEVRWLFRDLQADLRMGRWLFGGNLLALVSAQCNPWFLNGLLGSSFVGTYSICESLVNIPRAALTSLQNVMAPTVARAHHEGGVAGVRNAVQRLDRTLWAASCAFATGVAIAGPFAARLIYGYAPHGTRWVASLLAINLAVFAGTLAQAYGLTALKKADRPFYANLVGVVLQLSVSATLMRRFQVPGAAFALLLGNGAVLLVRQFFFSRATRDQAIAATPCEGAAIAQRLAV